MLPKIGKRKSDAGIKLQKPAFRRRAGRKAGSAGKWLPTVFGTLTAALVLNIGVSAAHRAILQRGISEEVLRFHVLANSDSEEDQNVKLLVRDAVLEWIYAELDNGNHLPLSEDDRAGRKRSADETAAAACDENQGGRTAEQQGNADGTDGRKEHELNFLAEHLREIEETANRVLAEQKMPYLAEASVENCYFPERTYGECTFPAGWYDALRIRLGEAKGHNWWCVLYPGLCFSDCLHAVVDGDELADLKEALTVEEYESLLRKPKKWKIAFRWF